MNSNIAYITIITCVLLNSCAQKSLNYNMSFPDVTMKLSEELNEISGLDLVSDSTIVSINDEKAVIYYLDVNSGEIISKFDFGKDQDFEGIAFNNGFYVLRSNGTITKVKKNKKNKEYKFKGGKHYDFEGITLDSAHNRLLIACKNHYITNQQDYVFIYSFSLNEKVYEQKPLFKISKKKVHQNFMPSGISIHPNGNIYVLSSFSKTLLVLSPNGKILTKTQLNSYIFNQPEGITFNKNGDLFIANEKNGTYPTLLKFLQQ